VFGARLRPRLAVGAADGCKMNRHGSRHVA
jgi:hypothetical protein